jgi:O-antigen/teichoic acid export membrane protein
MSWWQNRLESWKQDRILRLVLKNTSYMFSATGLSLAMNMLQSIFAARLLGAAGIGLVGVITTYAATVNRLFSFRMSEVVVKYMGGYLVEGEKERAGAVVRLAMLAEAITSVLAFICLLLLSPLAAHFLAKDDHTLFLFWIYGLSVLGSLIAESSTGVLQVTHKFREQALINVGQSILSALLIIGAFFLQGDILFVLLAYLLGKIILGVGPAVLAFRTMDEITGKEWRRASFSQLPPLRELAKFAISTNLSATLNLVFRDSELLWVSFFLSTTEAGYYKVALAIINLISIPITPFISTTYPQITLCAAEKNWKKLRSLLWRVTLISTGLTGTATLVLVLLGHFALLIYGVEYLPAYPILVILLIGYGIANSLFWNRPLLLALDRPETPFRVGLYTGLAKVVGALWVIPAFGVVGAAGLLSGYLGLSVCLIVTGGFVTLGKREKQMSLSGLENA